MKGIYNLVTNFRQKWVIFGMLKIAKNESIINAFDVKMTGLDGDLYSSSCSKD
jgi:hypothetical protein